MSEEQQKEQAVEKKDSQTGADPKKENSEKKNARRGGARRSFKGSRKSSRYGGRPKPEFDQKIINISRVTRVVKGGRRLSFRVDMVIGDKKGRVGIGTGKATDTSFAIQKAYQKARKNLIYLKLTKENSLPYEVDARVTSSTVQIIPNKGRGLVAGSTVRNVLQLAGITDVTAKLLSRSKNKLNNAKAAIKALNEFRMSPEEEKALKEKLAQKRTRSFQSERGKFRGKKSFNRSNNRSTSRGTKS